MKKIKKISKIFYWLIFIFVMAIAALAWFSVYEGSNVLKVYTVQSGSMEPTIKTGGLVIDIASENYKKNEIITYKVSKTLVTHRIVDIEEANGQKVFITKGDANNTNDFNRITRDQIFGRVIFTVPYLGYITNFAKTQTGIILLVVIPATIIVYSELITIKNEAIKLLKERKKRKLSLGEKVEVEIGEEEIKAERWYHRLFKKITRIFIKPKKKRKYKRKHK